MKEAHDDSFSLVAHSKERPWVDGKGNLYLMSQGILFDVEHGMTLPRHVEPTDEVTPYSKKSNEAILEYGTAIKGNLFNPASYAGAWRGDDVSWCSAFANWCLRQAGRKGTGLANARSWLSWGRSTARPFYGCVTVLWRGSPRSTSGHVGFFLGADGAHVWLLGGNQHDSVCTSRFPRSHVLDFRHDREATLPAIDDSTAFV